MKKLILFITLLFLSWEGYSQRKILLNKGYRISYGEGVVFNNDSFCYFVGGHKEILAKWSKKKDTVLFESAYSPHTIRIIDFKSKKKSNSDSIFFTCKMRGMPYSDIFIGLKLLDTNKIILKTLGFEDTSFVYNDSVKFLAITLSGASTASVPFSGKYKGCLISFNIDYPYPSSRYPFYLHEKYLFRKGRLIKLR